MTGFWVGPAWEPNLYACDGSAPPDFVSPKRHAAKDKKTAARHLGVVKKAAAAAGVTCKCAYVLGSFPYAEIIRAAQRERCDLIVMASHGRRGISRLLLGSVTSTVLAHASIPVLVCQLPPQPRLDDGGRHEAAHERTLDAEACGVLSRK